MENLIRDCQRIASNGKMQYCKTKIIACFPAVSYGRLQRGKLTAAELIADRQIKGLFYSCLFVFIPICYIGKFDAEKISKKFLKNLLTTFLCRVSMALSKDSKQHTQSAERGKEKIMKINEMKEVKVNEMTIKFFWKNGCPVMEVRKENVYEWCSGMDFFPDLIEVDNLDKVEIVRYDEENFNGNTERYNELHHQYFTEEDDEAITETIWEVFYNEAMENRKESYKK